MLLQSPKSLHYPITVTELLARQNQDVDRFAPLFSYSYKSIVTEGNKYGEETKIEKSYVARFDSETEGTLVNWKVAVGTVIDRPGVALAEINEPCKHETQFGGLCVICGKDMTEVDYGTTTPDSARANISMAHGNTALRVSQEEAARVEQDAKKRLLESKKLSLVVDLDQTIIHATVDPTVAEWMKDPSNPNYEAVKDVQAFQLIDDGPGRGCWYYIKLRPGLQDFLYNVSQIYELHIYTMGTRAYAMNIAKIVDPERKVFGDRILSRDESGSLTAKSLQRLFPTDTKMVVVIDDRGDVWSWSKNLIKVRPYDFFVGIGDINSSFLPKREELAAEELTNSQITPVSDDVGSDKPPNDGEGQSNPDTNGNADHATNGELSTLEKIVSMSGSNDAAAVKERTDQQDETLAAQLADRPLLQKQKILDKAEEEANEQANVDVLNGETTNIDPKGTPSHRHNLLQDDDTELYFLETALREVHRRFYETYRQSMAGSLGGRVAELRQDKPSKKRPDEDMSLVPQVQTILPDMKGSVLDGVVLVFSGVVPLGVDARGSDIGQWAQTFGAKVHLDLSAETTHVIASKTRRTAKVRAAARNPKIMIVTTAWLLDCLSQWIMLDVEPYIIEVEPDFKDRASSQVTNNSVWEEFNEALSSSESEDGAGTEDLDNVSEDPSAGATADKAKPRLGLHIVDFGTKKSRKRKSMGEDGNADDNNEDVTDDEELSPGSPVDDFEEQDWEEMSKEFDDMEDDDDESDGSQSDASERTEPGRPSGTQKGKRKRGPPTEDGHDTDTNGVDSAVGLGSELQVRKRRALGRTSSLNNVTTVDSLSQSAPPTSSPADGAVEIEGRVNKDGAEEDTDDGFDAEFEAELEAQLDAADDDSDVEGDDTLVGDAPQDGDNDGG